MTDHRADLFAAIERSLGSARNGLPEDVFEFVSRVTPLINVDLLITDAGGRTLLTWRDDRFYGPGWHVPGGVIRFQERAIERVHACARAELGADVDVEPAPLFVMESIGGDRTRGHMIALLFRCRLVSPLDESRRARDARPSPGQWRWHEACPRDLIPEQTPYASFFR
jgi:colanic acid biosynthesis protein WcaH